MKNLRQLACKFDLYQLARKSTQVNAQVYAGLGQPESHGDRSFQLASSQEPEELSAALQRAVSYEFSFERN